MASLLEILDFVGLSVAIITLVVMIKRSGKPKHTLTEDERDKLK